MEPTRLGAGVSPARVGVGQVADRPPAVSVNRRGLQSWCRPGLASGRGHLLAPGGQRGVQLQAFIANAGHGARSVRFVVRRTWPAWLLSCLCLLPKVLAPTPAHSAPAAAATRAEHDRRPTAPPLPQGRKRRETVVRLPAQTLRPSAFGVRTQASRWARTAGGAGVLGRRSSRPMAYSRETWE